MNKCSKCSLCFSSKDILRRHIKNIHNVSEELMCEYCDLIFSNNRKFEYHKKHYHQNESSSNKRKIVDINKNEKIKKKRLNDQTNISDPI